MRKTLTASVAALSVILSGCSAIRSELRHPGGYVGSKLDKHMIDAEKSKRLQVLRAAIVVAMVARAGAVYSRDGDETMSYVAALHRAADEVNYMAAYVTDPGGGTYRRCDIGWAGSPDTTKPCLYVTNFESDVPQMERGIFQLLVQALPQDAAREFLNSLKTGNFMSAAWDGVVAAFAAADGLRNAAAVNRSSIELQARFVTCPDLNASDTASRTKRSDSTVAMAAQCLGLDEHIFRASQKPFVLDDDTFAEAMRAVMQNIEHSCRRLPVIATPGQATPDHKCGDIGFAPEPRY